VISDGGKLIAYRKDDFFPNFDIPESLRESHRAGLKHFEDLQFFSRIDFARTMS